MRPYYHLSRESIKKFAQAIENVPDHPCPRTQFFIALHVTSTGEVHMLRAPTASDMRTMLHSLLTGIN